jgi:F-type H+-transporting ATPase subunit epsilon
MDALKLEVVTPERQVVDETAESVQLPGAEGYLGILPGHTPLITLLKTGVLSFKRPGGAEASYAVSAGFAEVGPERVSVLADSAESPAEIDAASAERDRVEAEKEMASADAESLPQARFRFDMAEARLAVARRR